MRCLGTNLRNYVYYLCREIYEVLDCMKRELLRIIKKNKIIGFFYSNVKLSYVVYMKPNLLVLKY